jgi:hypothetical protein
MRNLIPTLFVPLLAACAAPEPVAPEEVACGEDRVTVAAPASAPQAFRDDMRKAVVDVCGWWGATFAGRLAIEIDDAPGPSMALVPAWRGERGRMIFRARAVRERSAATVHEVVHVFAPNANRFLAEGLAVYGHEKLRGPSAYPNFARDLHAAARELAPQADLAALERLATPARLELPGGLTEPQGYVVAGSFVRVLVERHGLDRFRALYAETPLVPGGRDPGDPARWRRTYGVPFAALVAEWRGVVEGGSGGVGSGR